MNLLANPFCLTLFDQLQKFGATDDVLNVTNESELIHEFLWQMYKSKLIEKNMGQVLDSN